MVIASPLLPMLNHLLKGASWAPKYLAPFGTKTLKLVSGPVEVRLTVTAEGFVKASGDEVTTDLVIDLSPLAAARLLAGDRNARSEARISGDQDFARAVAVIADQVRWDAEEDLSRVVGDIAAHRLVESLRILLQWQRAAAASVARNITEYWVEEDPLIAARHRSAHFVAEVDHMRDDVERLLKRVDLLERVQP